MTTLSNTSTADLCVGTPSVQVLDNRGLMVRVLQFNRNAGGEVAARRVTQQCYGVRGELLSSIDPRLFEAQQVDPAVIPNFRYQSSLSGQVLRALSQDAGEEVSLFDIEQGVCWRTNGRAQTWRSYDVLHRLSSTVEQTGTAPPRISERYVYGESRSDAALANSRGQVFRHYDTAGLVETTRFNTSAQPLQQARQLLQDSMAESDWQGSEAQWLTHLAPERYLSRLIYDALGTRLSSVDAKGNVQRQQRDVAGRLASTGLRLVGEAQERSILSAISYSAAGQVLREVAGNGVVTDYTYEPQTQRLSRLLATRPAQSGRDSLLQDLHYTYDPVGNILSISNTALPPRYHQNQRIEPANHYQYDALYQLLCVRGRENASAGQQGLSLPLPDVPISTDPNQYSNYTRRYTYDRGGNLTQIQHQGRVSYTLDTVISVSSNHGVRQTSYLLPDEVEGFFDACGNLQQLAPGQPLLWDGRNQLQQVTQVVRSGPDNDLERYQYDGGGARLRKTTLMQTSGTQRSAEVIYLPGLELRRTQRNSAGASTLEEELHVISVEGAGRQQVRVLHWEAGRPSSMPNDQLRGSLGNQIGSSVLELDQEANVLTLEEYFPYGGTAVWSGKTASETQYKFARYSGKERDATGLYYYGFRYYAPWLGRWINPDPAGTVDGLNLFRFVRGNPVSLLDPDGTTPKSVNDAYKHMLTVGTDWTTAFGGLDKTYRGFTQRAELNLAPLKAITLNHAEDDFVKGIMGEEMYAVHFSSGDYQTRRGISFRSRVNLQDRGIDFSAANTEEEDLAMFATDDFAFFSLELGSEPKKPTSRFGSHRYRIPLDTVLTEKRGQYSHVEANDILSPDKRPVDYVKNPTKKPGWLRKIDVPKFQSSILNDVGGDVAVSADLLFGSESIQETMALNIVKDIRNLDRFSTRKIYNVSTSEARDKIVNTFYRPQLLVPHQLTLTKGDYVYTRALPPAPR